MKLPWDVRQQCLWIVRGYERARREYIKARREMLDASSAHFQEYTENGEEKRAYLPGSHRASRTTESMAERLISLDNLQAFRQMRAVEHARARIGAGMPPELQDALRDAIMLNCADGRKYPFERLFVVGISRADFYRARNAFFWEIARELGLIKE